MHLQRTLGDETSVGANGRSPLLFGGMAKLDQVAESNRYVMPAQAGIQNPLPCVVNTSDFYAFGI